MGGHYPDVEGEWAGRGGFRARQTVFCLQPVCMEEAFWGWPGAELLALIERTVEPNQPERVSDDALQLDFKQILTSHAHSEALEKALAET